MHDVSEYELTPFEEGYQQRVTALANDTADLLSADLADPERMVSAYAILKQIRKSIDQLLTKAKQDTEEARNFITFVDRMKSDKMQPFIELTRNINAALSEAEERLELHNEKRGRERFDELTVIGFEPIPNRDVIVVAGKIYTLGMLNNMNEVEWLSLKRTAQTIVRTQI